MKTVSRTGWIKGVSAAGLGLIAGITGAAIGLATAGDKPAQAQAFSGPAIEMAATTVGTVSHAYAVDTRMAQVIFCKAAATDARPVCVGVPIPGSAQR